MAMVANNVGGLTKNNKHKESEELKHNMQDGSSMWLWKPPRTQWEGEF